MPHLWRSSSTRGSSLVGGAADGVDDDASRRPEQLVPHPSFPTPVQDPEPSEAPRRTIGDSELSVFPVVLGGSVFGWTVDPDTTSDILDRFHDSGGNMVDTADSYAGGRSEILIGNWMRKRRNRDDMVVATKIGRLVIPVGGRQEQQLLVIQRRGEDWVQHSDGPCVFVPLIGAEGWRE
jgi:hypothetical protein